MTPSSTPAHLAPAQEPVPGHFRGLFDDAALFPPGNAPMTTAVARHFEHRTAWYGPMVGPFVCTDRRWYELADGLAVPGPMLPLSLVVREWEALPETLAAVRAHPRVRLEAVEFLLEPAHSGYGPAYFAAALPRTATVYAEVPLGEEVPAHVRMAAEAGWRIKFRTGGTEPGAFPSETALAKGLVQAVRAGVPFKLTAGLHQAIRHTGAATGFEHHGFLNALAATAAAGDGADEHTVARVLADRTADRVRAACTPARLAAARAWFTSFGTCSIDEPMTGLGALTLIGKD